MVLRHSRGTSTELLEGMTMPNYELDGRWFIQFLGMDKLRHDLIGDKICELFSNGLWKNINIPVENYKFEIEKYVNDENIDIIIFNKLCYDINDWINNLKFIKKRKLLAIKISKSEVFERLKIFTDIRLLNFNENEDINNVSRYIFTLIKDRNVVIINLEK